MFERFAIGRGMGTMVLTCLLAVGVGGCVLSIGSGNGGSSQAVEKKPRKGVDWQKWEYPNVVGRSVTNAEPGTVVLYQATTGDAFLNVLKHYESISGIADLANPHSAGQFHVESNGTGERIRAVQTDATFTRKPNEAPTNERSFLVRMPDYAVTAFVRQSAGEANTRITIVIETKP